MKCRSTRGYLFGNPIWYDEKLSIISHGTLHKGWWRYVDNDEITPQKDKGEKQDISRKCPLCNQSPRDDQHDPCIANLPGVRFACCGHGRKETAYILFEDEECIRGEQAIVYIQKIQKRKKS